VVMWEGYYQDWIGWTRRVLVGLASLFLLFPRVLTEVYEMVTGTGGPTALSEQELLAKAAAEAARLAQAGATSAAPAVNVYADHIPFWPDRVLVTLAGLALLLILLLPSRLALARPKKS
jgi:hypothetical protein